MKNKNLLNKSRIAFLAFFLLFTPCLSLAGTVQNWELAYENDENGTVVAGNLNSLVAFLKEGADLRVVVNWTGGSLDEKSDTIFSNRFGFFDNGSIVYSLSDSHSIGADASGNPILIGNSKPVILFRTDGVTEVISYNMSGNIVSQDTHNLKMRWFISR